MMRTLWLVASEWRSSSTWVSHDAQYMTFCPAGVHAPAKAQHTLRDTPMVTLALILSQLARISS